jgi:putative NIF3 family GTP cyclohydrolase 1 type 2
VTATDPSPAAGPPTLATLAPWLDRLLLADQYGAANDPAGVWRASDRPIAALGLLLEPWGDTTAWVVRERLDALVVHRPWNLPLERLGDVGVLAYHLAFDERLTLGFNPWLAEALGLRSREVLGRKQGRPLGMIGDVPERGWDAVRDDLAREFGGLDRVVDGDARTVARVAVVGAMTEALVREAAARGADAYVTGQLRVPARAAIEETGLAVVAVGHRRSEVWGMRTLARLLREGWFGLRVLLAPGLGDR